MTKIVLLALLTASLATFPLATPSMAIDNVTDRLCGPDGPEAYKRPGGYCEQRGAGSLVDGDNEGVCDTWLAPALFNATSFGDEILIADNCYINDGPEDQ